jgi:hypothetical protein
VGTGDAGVQLRTHKEGRSLGAASSLSPVRELSAIEWLPHSDPGPVIFGGGSGREASADLVEARETPTAAACLPRNLDCRRRCVKRKGREKKNERGGLEDEDVVLRESGVAHFQWTLGRRQGQPYLGAASSNGPYQ